MGDILVGTASWADKSLLDSRLFYPKEAKTAEGRLRYYATHFPLVEVDSSYYALPAPRVAELWAERTPASFVFDLKAFRLFTQHQTAPRVLPKDIQEALGSLAQKKNVYYADFPPELMNEMWRRFRLALEPLRHAGKLGAVLFQFPPWFYYRRSNLAHIAHCAQALEGYQLAVEFRNRTWFDDKHRGEVLDFEREHGLTHVVVDEPQGFTSSVPAVWEVTSQHACDLSPARAQCRHLGEEGPRLLVRAIRLRVPRSGTASVSRTGAKARGARSARTRGVQQQPQGSRHPGRHDIPWLDRLRTRSATCRVVGGARWSRRVLGNDALRPL